MAITSKFYPNAVNAMFNNDMNAGDNFKIMLLSNSYTYSDAHTAVSDVSGAEISGTGYSTGGYDYSTNITAALAGDNSKTEFTVPLALWTTATFQFYKAAIYNSTSNKLLMYLDFGGLQDVNGQNYQLNAPSPKPSATPV